MAKGNFTYQQVITKYKNAAEDKKDDILKGMIVKEYVDYQTKLTEVRKIVDLCSHSSIPDPADNSKEKSIYRKDTPLMYFLLKIRLIKAYTNIEIADDKVFEAYNTLDEVGMLDKLLSFVPETETAKWTTMLQMIDDDMYANERDLASYLDTKIDALGLVLGTMAQQLGDFSQKLEAIGTDDEN